MMRRCLRCQMRLMKRRSFMRYICESCLAAMMAEAMERAIAQIVIPDQCLQMAPTHEVVIHYRSVPIVREGLTSDQIIRSIHGLHAEYQPGTAGHDLSAMNLAEIDAYLDTVLPLEEP